MANQYDPMGITVGGGETVTLSVVNEDSSLHEFLLGDGKAHEAHGREMAGTGTNPMKMPDRPDLLDIDPGRTEQLTWMFPAALGLTVIYGSHEPGDYAGGLKDVITVSLSAARGGTGIEEPSTTTGGAEGACEPVHECPGPGWPLATGTGETGDQRDRDALTPAREAGAPRRPLPSSPLRRP